MSFLNTVKKIKDLEIQISMLKESNASLCELKKRGYSIFIARKKDILCIADKLNNSLYYEINSKEYKNSYSNPLSEEQIQEIKLILEKEK